MDSASRIVSTPMLDEWSLSRPEGGFCDEDHSIGDLPGQRGFIACHIIPAHIRTELPSDGTVCGICLERLVSVPTVTETPQNKRVIFLDPCQHFFHKECILSWFTSIRPERDTCPICRRALFKADPLTPEQLELLQADDLEDPHSHSNAENPHWVMMNGEYMAMDIVAGLVVRREFDSLDAFGGHFHWYDVCRRIHTAMLAVNGPLRPLFEPHQDTFVLLVHSAAALVAIGNNNLQIQEVDRREFLNWFINLLEQMGEPLVNELCGALHEDGLYITPLQPIIEAPWGYQDQPHMSANTIQDIVEVVMELRYATGLRATLRRVARRIWPRRLVHRLPPRSAPTE